MAYAYGWLQELEEAHRPLANLIEEMANPDNRDNLENMKSDLHMVGLSIISLVRLHCAINAVLENER